MVAVGWSVEWTSDFFGVKSPLDITWGHAVNSRAALNKALNGAAPVMFIEADVLMGKCGGESNIPIMAHPPSRSSDLTFQEFASTVVAHNRRAGAGSFRRVGIKIDFKDTSAVRPSLEHLRREIGGVLDYLPFPVWLNADILPGPNGRTPSMDAGVFLRDCKELLPSATLSPGFTTGTVGSVHGTLEALLNLKRSDAYNDSHFDALEALLARHHISGSMGMSGWGGGHITIPLQSSLARQGKASLSSFLKRNPQATITLWGEHTPKDAAWLSADKALEGRVFRDSKEPGSLFASAWDKAKSIATSSNAPVPAALIPASVDTPKPKLGFMTWVPGGNNSTSAPATAAPPKKVVVAHFDGKGKVNLKYEPREDHISAEEREAERRRAERAAATAGSAAADQEGRMAAERARAERAAADRAAAEEAAAEKRRVEEELRERAKKSVVVAHFDGKGKVNLKYEPREDHISAEEREAERRRAERAAARKVEEERRAAEMVRAEEERTAAQKAAAAKAVEERAALERAAAERAVAEEELRERAKKSVVVAHFDGKGKVNLKYEPREDHLSAEEREAERRRAERAAARKAAAAAAAADKVASAVGGVVTSTQAATAVPAAPVQKKVAVARFDGKGNVSFGWEDKDKVSSGGTDVEAKRRAQEPTPKEDEGKVGKNEAKEKESPGVVDYARDEEMRRLRQELAAAQLAAAEAREKAASMQEMRASKSKKEEAAVEVAKVDVKEQDESAGREEVEQEDDKKESDNKAE